MTRPLDPRTKPQRGGDDREVSREERERGFELSDADPRRVIEGLAAVVALMLAGIAFAGGLLAILRADEAPPREPPPVEHIAPPPPHLLEDPEAERRLIEQRARARLTGPELDRAMAATAAAGWGEEPPPPPEAAARAHAETVR